METCDFLTLRSTINSQSFTYMGKIITPIIFPRLAGYVKKTKVYYLPQGSDSRITSIYRITGITELSLALIIEANVHELRKKGVEITNSTKLATFVPIEMVDKNYNDLSLLKRIVGVSDSYGESSTAQILDDTVPPSAVIEGEIDDYGNINNFDLNNL